MYSTGITYSYRRSTDTQTEKNIALSVALPLARVFDSYYYSTGHIDRKKLYLCLIERRKLRRTKR